MHWRRALIATATGVFATGIVLAAVSLDDPRVAGLCFFAAIFGALAAASLSSLPGLNSRRLLDACGSNRASSAVGPTRDLIEHTVSGLAIEFPRGESRFRPAQERFPGAIPGGARRCRFPTFVCRAYPTIVPYLAPPQRRNRLTQPE